MFDWFWEFLYGLVKAALYCIDFIVDISEMLCGIEPVNIEGGGEVDITNYFLMHDIVINSFKAVALIGFALLFVFTIYSIIRSQGRLGEGKSPIRICIDSSKILLYFLLVPFIMYLASSCISLIMSLIYEATSTGGDGGIGSSLFCVFADEAYDSTAPKEEIIAQFLSGEKNYYSTSEVTEYFNLKDFNYFLGFVGGVSVLILLALSLLAFVERIISLMLLFIVAPISMSSAALDDGARFKLWRDQTINKFLMAYGSLIAINIYIMMVHIVNDIVFFEDSSFFNGLARLVFIIGGAFACRKAGALVGNLINHGAGSQDVADQGHLNSGFRMLAARALSPVVGAAMGVIAKPASLAAGHIKKDVSSAIHRRGNAKRFTKDEQQREAYKARLERSNKSDDSFRQNKSGRASSSPYLDAMRGKNTNQSATGLNSNTGLGSSNTMTNTPSRLNASANQITRDALANVSRKKEGGKKS